MRHNVSRNKLGQPKGRSEDEIGSTPRLVEALTATRHRRGAFVFKSLTTASRYINRRGASSRALNVLETSWRRGSGQR